MDEDNIRMDDPRLSMTGKIIRFSLKNKLVVFLFLAIVVVTGLVFAPFDWDIDWLPRDPVPVDAIPDIGENQQIVFTEWMGRSPQDIEDQITYQLTVALMGIPGVDEVRSLSAFGFSQIFVIFEEGVEFYWSRSRILEKLNALPTGLLPDGVQPMLGPDATALGQVYWYSLQGRDPDGNPVGGWDLEELRTVQDWYVRQWLLSAGGISEVASIGGFQREYQIDVDPEAMVANGVSLQSIYSAVRMSNVDVGAKTIEINNVEYVIRGLGFIESLEDIENIVVKVSDNVPLLVKDIATVKEGPALRRGAIDIDGSEAVGGVVIVRHGYNPLEAINNLKNQIEEVSSGLPRKAVIDSRSVSRSEVEQFAGRQGFSAYNGINLNQDAWMEWLTANSRDTWPEWVTTSQVTIVPFYDRSELIHETLGTLGSALFEQILVTIIVIIVLLLHLRSSLLVSSALPISVLMCFIFMKFAGVDANIVSLSGIAIAIGTIVDMSIILTENILRHLDDATAGENSMEVVFRASNEVGGAVLTAVSTTIVSFLPVFTMIGSEGKLFKPLAFTKTFVLLAAIIVALAIVPPAAYLMFSSGVKSKTIKRIFYGGLAAAGVVAWLLLGWLIAGLALIITGFALISADFLPGSIKKIGTWITLGAMAIFVGVILCIYWEPLGPEPGLIRNFIFVGGMIGSLLALFYVFRLVFPYFLRWFLAHKIAFLCIPAIFLLLGANIWLGFEKVFAFVPTTLEKVGVSPADIRHSRVWMSGTDSFPGLGREFMPALDEGSFLWMPTIMPHGSIGEAMDVMQKQDMAMNAIPEVESVVGKLGRAETPLDPAPISMIETIIEYKSEYIEDDDGRRMTFSYDIENGEFIRDNEGELIPDPRGRPYRQWREHIKSPDDIWDEIARAGEITGSTSASKLMPIETRLVMLQTGMRAPMGMKVYAPDLETLERLAIEMEEHLRQVPMIRPETVNADRVIGKPYIEIDIDREKAARYGLHIGQIQNVIEVAVGGKMLTSTVEGRERFPVRVRYKRELRDSIEELGRILVTAADGAQIPIEQVAEIRYVRGPMVIKAEDTFLVAYVTFGPQPGFAEVDVVEQAIEYLDVQIEQGELILPPGVSYNFAGTYEHQIRAARTLAVVLPLALFIIFMILYLQFKSIATTLIVFAGILIAWSGGFILIWLYGLDWFMDFSVFGTNMRELFGMHSINMSVAIWVGFLALFGIAVDNGVVMATYLDQTMNKQRPGSVEDIHKATIAGATRRVRPCLMTTATTLLALLPVLTSTGRGSDIMIPMAIPSFGGMSFVMLTLFVVPVLYAMVKEIKLKRGLSDDHLQSESQPKPE